MKNFDRLLKIFKKLNTVEKRQLNYLCINNLSKKPSDKTSDLLVLLNNNKQISAHEAQQLIYNKTNYSAFSKLVDRLIKRINEAILMDQSLVFNDYPLRTKEILSCRKRLMLADILSYKGLRDEADKISRAVIKRANFMELYDVCLDAYFFRQRFISIRSKFKQQQSLISEIENMEVKNHSYRKSHIIFNQTLNLIATAENPIEYKDKLNDSIDELSKYYQITGSSIIKFYYLFLKTESLQIQNNYEAADEVLSQLDNLINNKPVYTINRKGTNILNIAHNKLFLRKYDDAIMYSEQSIKYFPSNIINQSLAYEIILYCNLYKENYHIALEVINILRGKGQDNNILFNKFKWLFIYSVLKFISKDYRQSLNILLDLEEVQKDRDGWNFNKRLMTILCYIELKEYDKVELEIQNLDKFYKRLSKSKYVLQRYLIIIKILKKLINDRYDFNNVFIKRMKYFKLLSEGGQGYEYVVKGPEVLEFTKWFTSKIL